MVCDTSLISPQLSQGASFDNSIVWQQQGIGRVFHLNIPAYPASAGTDTFQVQLTHGWKVDRAHLWGIAKKQTVNGNAISFEWTSPKVDGYQGTTSQDKTFSYDSFVFAVGPSGVPMK